MPTSSEKSAPLSAAAAFEEANDRGRGAQAIAALGDAAQESLEKMGAFPVDDEAPDEIVTESEPVPDAAGAEAARHPGDD